MSVAGWFKSSFSDNGPQCVEVRFDGESVLVRDSKYTGDPSAQPVITVSAAQWATFLTATINGGQSVPTMRRNPDGFVTLSHNSTDLTYTPAEWDAFVAGVVAGEFSHAQVLAI